jgi:Protein of unknown function (DUF3632)
MKQRRNAIQKISKSSLSEPEKIDAISIERNWFRGTEGDPIYEGVKSYMAGLLDLKSTVKAITGPIDLAYSSADNGQAILRAEDVADSQRTYCSSEEAIERWGEPLRESDLPVRIEDDQATTEGLLWELWHSVLHTAKKTPWRDTAAQGKLLNLVRALKEHPDPAPPKQMTKALENDWIWSSGTVWRGLEMLGPSARECWNDCPGCGSGFSLPELHAWMNLNAFVAHLTRAGLAEFWIYSIWAMRPALEDEKKSDDSSAHEEATVSEQLDADVPAAAVWALILGKALWQKVEDLSPKNSNEGNPGGGGDLWKGKSEFSNERYVFWAERFKAMSERDDLMTETRQLAGEVYKEMVKLIHLSI